MFSCRSGNSEQTKRMTAAELRLLRVLGLELITNTIEQLDVALLGVLFEGRNERPRHGSCSLARDVCVLPVIITCISQVWYPDVDVSTYDVWLSLLPLHMITSAGLVLVRRFFSLVSPPVVAFLKSPVAVDSIPPMSPFAYEPTMPNRPCPASLAKLGSLSTPCVE